MSVLFADNFQTYGTTEANMLDGIWAEIGNYTSLEDDPDATAPADSKALKINQNGFSSNYTRFVLPAALATAGSSFRVWNGELPSSTDEGMRIFSWRDINNAELAHLKVRTTGQLTLNYNGSDVATSTLPVLTAAAFHHVEAKITFNASTGAFECRVNGVVVAGLTLSSQNFGSTNCSQIAVGKIANGAFGGTVAFEDYVKDFVVWDTNGSQNNDFLGSVQVYTLQVDGDSSLNWTPSTGSTGYDLIDELDPSDADYIEADATPPAAAVFTLENVPEDVVAIRALIPVVRARKTDGGAGNVQASLTVAGDNDDGADRPLTTSFTYGWDVSELSPDTANPWTPAEVDAATLKINRTV